MGQNYLRRLLALDVYKRQADGDVIDFVSRLENVSPKEAALMLAQDFSIPYEDKEPPGRSRRPKQSQKQESPEQQFRRKMCIRDSPLPLRQG